MYEAICQGSIEIWIKMRTLNLPQICKISPKTIFGTWAGTRWGVAISLAWPTLWGWIWTCLKHVLDGPWHGWGHHVFHCQWLSLPSHRGQTVYVMMGTVWADCDVSMNYVNGLETGEGTPWTSKSVIRNQSKILLMDTMCNVNHTKFHLLFVFDVRLYCFMWMSFWEEGAGSIWQEGATGLLEENEDEAGCSDLRAHQPGV